MNLVLKEILQTGYVTSESGPAIKAIAHIPEQEGEFLQQLIRELKPQVSLEIGLAYGVSSLYICETLAEVQAKRHIVIDPYQHSGWDGIGLRNLRRAGYEGLIDFYELSSHRVLPRLENEGCKIDFAFVDGWHTFDYTLVEFFLIDKILRVGGIIVFDDTGYPSIRKVCRYIATNHSYTALPTPSLPGSSNLSWKRKLLRRLLQAPVVSKYRALTVKPEILEPDMQLGLSEGNYIAFRKDAEDVLGDGANGTRRWDFYREF